MKKCTNQKEIIEPKETYANGTYTPPMNVNARIHSINPDGAVRARLSLNLGDVFAVRGVKLMDGKNGYFLSMPSYKSGDTYRDICFSFDEKFTQHMTAKVVQEYEQTLEQTHQASQNHEQTSETQNQTGNVALFEEPGDDVAQQMATM